MKDIQNRSDLEKLMALFYAKLLADPIVNYVFTDVAKIDIETHLPHIVDFWEQILFNTGNYRKNVLQLHLELNEMEALTTAHFDTWLGHFNTATDQCFQGENAEKIKTRALSIATIMQIKIAQP